MNYLPASIKLNDNTDWPRRSAVHHFTPVEKAIYEITAAVEAMGDSPSLTKAVCSLQDARNAVADHLEGKLSDPPMPWQVRVELEQAALNLNIEKLSAFLNSPASKDLGRKQLGAMKDQLNAMNSYSSALSTRLAIAKVEQNQGQ